MQEVAETGRDLCLDGAGSRVRERDLSLITPLLGGKKVVFSIPKFDQATVRYFKELMESGEFKPVIDRRYSLDQIAEAYRYVETGQKIGNVVISVVPPSN
jgi:NADPH:quinone reductase-like Zn-dependent oxidoreductase